MKRKILILMMLAGFILAVTGTFSEAEDTYNFYFQKAPGPQIVNQGSAGQTSLPQQTATQNPLADPAPVASAPAVATLNSPAEAPSASSDYKKWEFSLGYSAPIRDKDLFAPQYTVGLQLNITDTFGIYGEFLHSRHQPDTQKNYKLSYATPAVATNKNDWSAGAVLTPFRFRLDSAIGISLSAMGGVMSGAVVKPFYGSLPQRVTSGYLGGRLGLEVSRKVALNASVRKVKKTGNTLGTLALTYMF